MDASVRLAILILFTVTLNNFRFCNGDIRFDHVSKGDDIRFSKLSDDRSFRFKRHSDFRFDHVSKGDDIRFNKLSDDRSFRFNRHSDFRFKRHTPFLPGDYWKGRRPDFGETDLEPEVMVNGTARLKCPITHVADSSVSKQKM